MVKKLVNDINELYRINLSNDKDVVVFFKKCQECNKDAKRLNRYDLKLEVLRAFSEKIRSFNPDLSDETLRLMFMSLEENPTSLPVNFYVINNIVFSKQYIKYNNSSYIELQCPKFNNIFQVNEFQSYNFRNIKERNSLSNEDERQIKLFIINNLNSLLQSNFEEALCLIGTRIHNKAYDDGNKSLIWLDQTFLSIAIDMKNKVARHYKMIIALDDEIQFFDIEQTFNGNLPSWNINPIETTTWNLQDTVNRRSHPNKCAYPYLTKHKNIV